MTDSYYWVGEVGEICDYCGHRDTWRKRLMAEFTVGFRCVIYKYPDQNIFSFTDWVRVFESEDGNIYHDGEIIDPFKFICKMMDFQHGKSFATIDSFHEMYKTINTERAITYHDQFYIKHDSHDVK